MSHRIRPDWRRALNLLAVVLLIVGLFSLTSAHPDRAAAQQNGAADIAVTLQTQPSIYVSRGERLDIDVLVENMGDDSASSISVTLPFDTDQLTLNDVHFRQGQSWIGSYADDSITLIFDHLEDDDDRSATIYTDVSDMLIDDTEIALQASYAWSDADNGGRGLSNEVVLTVDGPAPVSSRTLQEDGDVVVVDTIPPASQIVSLTRDGNGYRVEWAGTDAGSGVAAYDVQICRLPCEVYGWQNWMMQTQQISNWFGPVDGKEFAFRVRAYDWAGNVEPWPDTPDLTTLQVAGT